MSFAFPKAKSIRQNKRINTVLVTIPLLGFNRRLEMEELFPYVQLVGNLVSWRYRTQSSAAPFLLLEVSDSCGGRFSRM